MMAGATAQAGINLSSDGVTLHRMLGLKVPARLESRHRAKRKAMLQPVDCVVVDEALFCSADLLELMDEALREATDTFVAMMQDGVPRAQALACIPPFGFRSVLLLGDCSQLPSIPKRSMS